MSLPSKLFITVCSMQIYCHIIFDICKIKKGILYLRYTISDLKQKNLIMFLFGILAFRIFNIFHTFSCFLNYSGLFWHLRNSIISIVIKTELDSFKPLPVLGLPP